MPMWKWKAEEGQVFQWPPAGTDRHEWGRIALGAGESARAMPSSCTAGGTF